MLVLMMLSSSLRLLPADEPRATSRENAVSPESPRWTPQVRMLQKAVPAVTSVFAFLGKDDSGRQQGRTGSASTIDAAGYALTAAHVVTGAAAGIVQDSDGKQFRFMPIAELEAYDLAIIRILASEPIPTLPVGRSHDLMLGEPIVAIGNPHGVGLSVSEGILSGLNRYSLQSDVYTSGMVQTSAPLFRGNSGGPLVNAEGAQIGMALRLHSNAESLGLAMGADRIRELIPRVLAIDARDGITPGCDVDPLVDPPTLISIDDVGPAADAKLQLGDQVVKVDGKMTTHAYQWPLTLVGRKAGETIQVEVLRGDRRIEATLTLAEAVSVAAVDDETAEATEPGVVCTAYRLDPRTFNNTLEMAFRDLDPKTSFATGLELDAVKPRDEYFAIRFDGFLKVPASGVYTFNLASDDGSRLTIGGRDLIVNDGGHPAVEESCVVRLDEGLVPFRLDYFQGRGRRTLNVRWQHGDAEMTPLPDTVFYRSKVAP
ncbi:PA14 domain protein [Rhodopirellula maiorica SM1]|uniref:PA14 domain protein n=2 Tax=Novipirellula TaxID=2795426 RepID=M5RKS2_9BACT|nr:PA14 domain protein [Rhodopirellula maiorica SM1]